MIGRWYDPVNGYAEVNGLRMYYEVHGEGRPLVLLHGAYQTVDTIGPILPGLAETRQVIVPELVAHGRTADIDRPITYEGMADHVAALMGTSASTVRTSSASAWAPPPLSSSPSATPRLCAGWYSSRSPLGATARSRS